jgi:hypothetical protein
MSTAPRRQGYIYPIPNKSEISNVVFKTESKFLDVIEMGGTKLGLALLTTSMLGSIRS